MAKQADIMEPQPVPQMAKAPRHINCHHMGGDPCATPDEQVLHISTKDQAEWGSSEGRRFTIDFKSRSPFAKSLFQVPVVGTVPSGPITGGPGTYKYSLVNDQGKVKDPTIIIQA